MGYSRKNLNKDWAGEGEGFPWNFQEYQRNSMWNFQGLIEKKMEFPKGDRVKIRSV